MGRVETDKTLIGGYELGFALNAGPRITSFSRPGAPSPFASLGDAAIEHPAAGRYVFIGGHRLWRAPEVPAETYIPDDRPVSISDDAGVLVLTGAPDPFGIVKQISVEASDDAVVVRHQLRNAGDRDIRCALWGITQLKPGGTAIMPQPPIDPATDRVVADRSLVLWPYTDPTAEEIRIDREAVFVAGSDREEKMKIGQTNRVGWVGYVHGSSGFIKWSERHRDDREYADLGASVQVYRDARFVELESLSPVATLGAGEAAAHVEVWTLLDVSGVDDPRLARLPDPTEAWS